MKINKLIIFILFIMTNITGCAQSNLTKTTISKDSLIGKTFEAEVQGDRGRESDGKSISYFSETDYYCLRFEKDSVEITYRHVYRSNIQQSDKSESKTYNWNLKNDEIIIENFSEYGKLIFKADQIYETRSGFRFKTNQIIGKNKFGDDLMFNQKDY